MVPVNPQSSSYMIGVIFGALMVGGLCGLLPFFVGLNRNNMVLGSAGLISCIVGGLILGMILAVPLAVIFTIIIVAVSASSNRR